jgi:hypothetical protein
MARTRPPTQQSSSEDEQPISNLRKVCLVMVRSNRISTFTAFTHLQIPLKPSTQAVDHSDEDAPERSASREGSDGEVDAERATDDGSDATVVPSPHTNTH